MPNRSLWDIRSYPFPLGSSTMQCSSLLLFCLATSILIRFGAASSSAFIDDLFEPECLVARNLTDDFGQLPPTKKTPWAVINLDLPAEQRFGLAYRPFASRLQKTVSLVKAMMRSLVGQAGVNLFEALMAQLHDRLFPASYQQEMEGVAQATGLSVPDLTALNLFYELAHLCTSIVAEDPQGRLVHGRTLDFGVVLGWDRHRHGWLLTQQLRALTLNLNFTRHERSLFLGTTFAGHLGLLTGMRPHKFSVSVNSRLRSSGWSSSLHSMASLLLQSAMAHSADSAASPVLWAQRNMLEQCADFEQAQRFLSTVPLMSGCFFALGGNSSGQGLILVRNRTSLEQQQQLNPTEGRWFLLQRNYAPGQPAFFLDGRAGTEKCLQRLGRPRANWEGLLTVLSSKNTLNKCTVHTTMMNVREGLYQTYLQNCPEPCWFI